MIKKVFALVVTVLLLWGCSTKKGQEILVENASDLAIAIENANAGDEIIMKNGVWTDVEIKFRGVGTAANPITLRAETAGEVFIEGKSFLKLAGEYLVVDGLYFRNGYTPSHTVVDFRIGNEEIANNCRVTNCVIEEFTQPDRDQKDHWVEFWGRNNQMDHCYLAGKSNQGPTVRVFLKGNEHINTYHSINDNHFGPRPRKGGPRAETMQIGDSYTSMTPAYVQVKNNFFERCNGEVEIISSKANFNEFRNNIFFECEGSLVLRHGNYATIDGNIFIGNDNSPFIGGIRVINTGHWVTNNYFYKLKGEEFRSPLAVMNGIPKSPLNRYNQVTDVVVAYNSYIDCTTPFHFSVGANIDQSEVLPPSEIRSARPERVLLANNLVYNNEKEAPLIKAYDKVDGVTFKQNIWNFKVEGAVHDEGLIQKQMAMNQHSNWLYSPTERNDQVYEGFDFDKITTDMFGNERLKDNGVGAILSAIDGAGTIDYSAYGPHWFESKSTPGKMEELAVNSEEGLVDALGNLDSDKILVLASGSYNISESITVGHKVIIKSNNKDQRVVINVKTDSESPAFKMLPKGTLKLENVTLNGTGSQTAFATLEKEMSVAYNLFFDNVQISDFKQVLEVSKGSFADTISIVNSTIENCKTGIDLAKETNDKGDYNAGYVKISNSTFNNIAANVLNYYRGGYDESTIGGMLDFSNNDISNCGQQEETGILIKTRGIVNVKFAENRFTNNRPKYVAVLWGEKGQQPENNTLKNSGVIKVEQNLKLKLMY